MNLRQNVNRSTRRKNKLMVFRKMTGRNRIFLGLAVFCLFIPIGLIQDIMREKVIRGTEWFSVFHALLSGGIATIIVLNLDKIARLLIGVAFCWVLFAAGLFIENNQLKDLKETRPGYFELSQENQDYAYRRRFVDGAFILIFISLGYGLFIHVVGRETGEKNRVEAELNVARGIQTSLLPASNFQMNGFEVSGLTIPAAEVGGDYFDYFKFDDHQLGIVVADVSGHGVQAGILMAMLKSALYAQLKTDFSIPYLLPQLNSVMTDISDKDMFITFSYIIMDSDHKLAVATTCGHPPFYHYNRTTNLINEIRTPSLALGLKKDAVFTETFLTVGSGDLFLCFTDGIIEAADKKGEEFGFERLKILLQQHVNQPAEEICQEIIKGVKNFTSLDTQEDDMTLVVTKIT